MRLYLLNVVLNLLLLLSLLFIPVLAFPKGITLDGQLNEEMWLDAVGISGFQTTQPFSLADPHRKTEVKITSDKKGIWIGFKNYQPQNESINSTTLKDGELSGDFNEVIIKFDELASNGFGFKVSIDGAVQDSVWSSENGEDIDWDGEWNSAVYKELDFWSVEIFIPWSITSMSLSDDSSRIVEYYVSRSHRESATKFSSPAISPDKNGFLNQFSKVQLAYEAGTSLDVFPYISGSRNLLNEESEARAGVDIFWKPKANQQLNLSINPDFGSGGVKRSCC